MFRSKAHIFQTKLKFFKCKMQLCYKEKEIVKVSTHFLPQQTLYAKKLSFTLDFIILCHIIIFWRVVFKCFCDQKLFPTYLSCLIKLSLFRHIQLSYFRLSTLFFYSTNTYTHTHNHKDTHTHTIERKCNVIKIISLDNTIEMRTKLVCLKK